MVVIRRGHRHEKWTSGRSVCEHCGKELHWWELVPSISYLALRGKCSSCKTKIDPSHFIGETVLGMIYTVVWVSYLYNKIDAWSTLSIMTSLTIIWLNVMNDLLYKEVIPIPVYIAIIIVSIINHSWMVSVALLLVDLIITFLSKDEIPFLGTGDLDILILAYATLGSWLKMVDVLFYMSLSACIVYMIYIRKLDDKRIPLVPFIFIGLSLTLLGVGPL